MSFAARHHVAAAAAPASGVQALGTMDLGGVSATSEDFTVALSLNADGTLAFTNNMNLVQTSIGPSNWFTPTTGAVGAGYRVRFTLQSGTPWAEALTSGTLYALSSARTLTWTLPLSGTIAAQVLVEITSAANTTVLGAGTLYVNMYDEY